MRLTEVKVFVQCLGHTDTFWLSFLTGGPSFLVCKRGILLSLEDMDRPGVAQVSNLKYPSFFYLTAIKLSFSLCKVTWKMLQITLIKKSLNVSSFH